MGHRSSVCFVSAQMKLPSLYVYIIAGADLGGVLRVL